MKRNSKIISALCLALIIILLIGKVGIDSYHPDYSYGIDSYTIEENERDFLDDEERSADQKLNKIKLEKLKYTQGYESFTGWSGGIIGLIKPSQGSTMYKDPDVQEYLKLSKIGLAIQEINGPYYLAYYTKNGEGYLSKTKLSKRGKQNHVSYVSQKVNYNYSAEDNSILIPVNSAFWKTCIEVSIYIFMALLGVGYLYGIKLFFEFLLAISKNIGFEEENVYRLRKMALILLLLGVISYILNLIVYLIFSLNHLTDGVIITYSFWEHDYFMVILSALCYLIYTAFKKAMILQKEQDLTI
ncbi:MAG: DUF2975 domain-containing protein [Bacteroidota bacterium]